MISAALPLDHDARQPPASRTILTKRVFALAYFALVTLATTASAEEAGQSIELIEKWIDVRKEDAELRKNWLAEKQQLEHEDKLLQAEIDSLSKRVEALETINSELLEIKQTQGSEVETLQEASADTEKLLKSHREKITLLIPKLPPPLAQSIKSKLAANDSRNNGLGARYQRIISALVEIHEFASEVHWKVEIRQTSDGASRQLDTLYWGLHYALSSDKNGTISQIGFPGIDGWKWEDADAQTTAIRTFLNIQQGLESPSFISVPLPQR